MPSGPVPLEECVEEDLSALQSQHIDNRSMDVNVHAVRVSCRHIITEKKSPADAVTISFFLENAVTCWSLIKMANMGRVNWALV
jgi:hypothetical protein